MSSADHSDLVDMDVFEAIQKKYVRGRKENGERWVGPRPLVCLHDEIIDALVYAELEYSGCSQHQDVLKEIIQQFMDISRGLVVLLDQIPKESWDKWEV